MTDSNGVKPSNEELQDTPAAVINAPGEIWLTFGDLSEFNGCQVEYADASRASDVSWCEEQIEASDVKYIRADLVSQRQQPDPYAIHTCSYHCSRPECIKHQRDQMRDWIHDTLGSQRFAEMMTYKKESAK